MLQLCAKRNFHDLPIGFMSLLSRTPGQKFFKVIACEIAIREFNYAAAVSRNLVDLEFLTQGYHDIPGTGRKAIQECIDAVPAGKYDAVILGYGLCSKIVEGLRCSHTSLVIPRAHDCITFFLGSKERYQQCFNERPGTYYYTSGWLECACRRGDKSPFLGGASVPANLSLKANYEDWLLKYGEDQANFLMEEMSRWTQSYSHGTWIQLEFLKHLEFRKRVQSICAEKGWEYNEIEGDLNYFTRLLEGDWPPESFLVVPPGETVTATHDDRIIGTGSR